MAGGIRTISSGPACLIEGYRLLLQPGLRRFVLLPLLGNVLLFSLASLLAFAGLEWAIDRWLPESLGWLRWLLFPLLGIGLLATGLFTFTLVANLLLGPFLGRLADAVLRRRGIEVAEDQRGFWLALRQDTGVELRRLAYVLGCLLAVAVLGLVPVIGAVAAPLGVLVSAWLLAVEFSAQPIGQFRQGLAEQLGLLRQHRGSALAFGLSALAAMLVPVLNFALVPAAVAGMSLWVADRQAAE